MIEEIVFLKSRKEQIQNLIKDHKASLHELEEELKFLDDKIDNTVVDGLRMRVREFIQVYQGAQLSPRLQRLNTKNLNWIDQHRPERTPYLQGVSREGAPISSCISLTEEEAQILSAWRQAYNIDCSVWDTYRYPGEID